MPLAPETPTTTRKGASTAPFYRPKAGPARRGTRASSGQASRLRGQGEAWPRWSSQNPASSTRGKPSAPAYASSGRGSGKRARTQGLPTSPHQYWK